jgi:hypothetical protein
MTALDRWLQLSSLTRQLTFAGFGLPLSATSPGGGAAADGRLNLLRRARSKVAARREEQHRQLARSAR